MLVFLVLVVSGSYFDMFFFYLLKNKRRLIIDKIKNIQHLLNTKK